MSCRYVAFTQVPANGFIGWKMQTQSYLDAASFPASFSCLYNILCQASGHRGSTQTGMGAWICSRTSTGRYIGAHNGLLLHGMPWLVSTPMPSRSFRYAPIGTPNGDMHASQQG